MGIPVALAVGAALNLALDGPDMDLESLLHALGTSLSAAVGSYQGLSMTLAADSYDISFTVWDGETDGDDVSEEAGAAVTSLLIPLSALSSAGAGGRLVLYAATAGAFVDLAADLSYALGLDAAALTLDQHRTLREGTTEVGMDGLKAHSAINQAVGVLIDRGHTPESAYQELLRRAALDGGDVLAVAEQVLLSVTGPASAPVGGL